MNGQQTIDRITHHVSIPIIGKKQYTKKRDIVRAQVHFKICKEIGVKLDNEHWNDHIPNQSIRVLKVS